MQKRDEETGLRTQMNLPTGRLDILVRSLSTGEVVESKTFQNIVVDNFGNQAVYLIGGENLVEAKIDRVGLGIGVVFDESKVDNTGDLFPKDDEVDKQGPDGLDPEKLPECKRDLMVSITKNRDNPTGSFKVYQGRTLRFYGDRTEEQNEVEYYNKKHNTQIQ